MREQEGAVRIYAVGTSVSLKGQNCLGCMNDLFACAPRQQQQHAAVHSGLNFWFTHNLIPVSCVGENCWIRVLTSSRGLTMNRKNDRGTDLEQKKNSFVRLRL
jgi:hypothetical protein